jgi:hypothetical protein
MARGAFSMSPKHVRYLLLEQAFGGAVVNFALNGAIAFASFHSLATVPLWGRQSIAADTVATTLLLPLVTCLIVTPLARRRVRRGTLPRLEWPRSAPAALGRAPGGTFSRALLVGGVSLAVVAPPALWALSALGVTAMSFAEFLLFKATFAAALAAAVTPAIGLCVLAEPSGLLPASDRRVLSHTVM